MLCHCRHRRLQERGCWELVAWKQCSLKSHRHLDFESIMIQINLFTLHHFRHRMIHVMAVWSGSIFIHAPISRYYFIQTIPNSKVHGPNMGPTWVLSAPDGSHVGPMNFAPRGILVLRGLCNNCREHSVTTLTLSKWSSSGNPVEIQCAWNLDPSVHWNATGEMPVCFQWLSSGLPVCSNYAN